MFSVYKFRLYPNTNQARELGIMLETHRRLYNRCLEMRNTAYASYKLALNYFDQSAWFTHERHSNPWFDRLNFSSAQRTMRRLHGSFVNFYRRVKAGGKPGYPRFKSVESFKTIEFTYNNGIRVRGNLRVQNIGSIRCKFHRKMNGVIKNVSLKRERMMWFAIFTCDIGDEIIPKSQMPAIGIDLGIEAFISTSDGIRVDNPRFLKNSIDKIRRAQRSLSRKKRGGKNRNKFHHIASKISAKVSNRRRDHSHKTALNLVSCYGLIAVERLMINNLAKNHRMARSIMDVGWGQFVEILKHKAAKAGVRVVDVDPRYTSQECSKCGQVKQKLLSERWHSCSCGLSIHRDVNSAKVILARGLALSRLARTEPVGANVGVTMPRCPRSRLAQRGGVVTPMK